MHKHTQGAWAAMNWVHCSDGGDVPTHIKGEGKPYGRLIAEINFDANDPELSSEKSSANAKLIAMSPTMYDYILEKAKEGDIRANEIIKSIDY